jgi:hypothetical protein
VRLAFRWRFFLSLGAAGDRTLIEHATDIRMRAEDQAGILLRKMAEHDERPSGQKKESHVATLSDLGVTKTQSSRWRSCRHPDAALEEERHTWSTPSDRAAPTGAKARGRRGFGAVTVDAPLMRKAQRQRRSLNMRMMLKILIPTETGNPQLKTVQVLLNLCSLASMQEFSCSP